MKYVNLKDFSLILNEEILDKYLRERAEAEVEVMYKLYLNDIKSFMIKHDFIASGKLKPKLSMIPDDINMLKSLIENGFIKAPSNSKPNEKHNSNYADFSKIRFDFSEADLKQYVESSIHQAYIRFKNFIKFIVQKHNDMIVSSISRSEIQDKEILECLLKNGCIGLDAKQVSSEHVIEINTGAHTYPMISTMKVDCYSELGAAANKADFLDDA